MASSQLSTDDSASPRSYVVLNEILMSQGKQIDVTETVELPLYQRKGESVYFIVTFPTPTVIMSITPKVKGREIKIIQQIASVYGSMDGFSFDDKVCFPAGDYFLALTCENEEETKQVTGASLQIAHEKISSFNLSQMIFALCRSLGFEPGHMMKYPSRTPKPPTSYHRKIRSEIQTVMSELKKYEQLLELLTRINQLSTMLGEISTHIREMGRNGNLIQEQIKNIQGQIRSDPEITAKLDQMQELLAGIQNQEKGSDVQTITVPELEKLIDERNRYYEKLVEAEDYIERMEP